MKILKALEAHEYVDEMAEVLRGGGLVCFAIRGTYRLVADAASEDAVMKLMQSKRRSSNHPALLLVPDLEAARQVVDGCGWSMTRKLAQKFWPGPLTLLLPPSDELPGKIKKVLTRATGKIGVRVADDPFAARVVAAFGGPLLVSSANLAKKPGATSSSAIRQRFNGVVELWVDTGDTTPGPESTLVEVEDGSFSVVREGAIKKSELDA